MLLCISSMKSQSISQHTGSRKTAEYLSLSDEQALLQGMLAGEAQAWRMFHQRFRGLIWRCITKMLGRHANEEDVREVYATLMVQLLSNDMHKLRSFDPERGNRLSSWLGLLATHCACDYARGQRRYDQQAPLGEDDWMESDVPSPYEVVVHKERMLQLSSALSALTEKDREFVTLYFGEDLPAEQVAQRMQISLNTVYSKRSKIQARLCEMMSEGKLAA